MRAHLAHYQQTSAKVNIVLRDRYFQRSGLSQLLAAHRTRGNVSPEFTKSDYTDNNSPIIVRVSNRMWGIALYASTGRGTLSCFGASLNIFNRVQVKHHSTSNSNLRPHPESRPQLEGLSEHTPPETRTP